MTSMCQSGYALKVEIMYIERFELWRVATKVPWSQQVKTDLEGIFIACSRLSDGKADA